MDTCNLAVSSKNECLFLNKVIDSFEKLLAFMPDETFGSRLVADLQFEGTTSLRETVTLTLQGKMFFIYGIFTQKPLPKVYTPEDINIINQIWDYLEHPEYKIVL